MAKLEWDKSSEKFYELGIDHGVLFVQNTDGTYQNGKAWNGLTGVTESPEGAEPNDVYADNIKYASLRSAETFGFTIEAYQSPAEFDVCDGMASPADGLSIGQQGRTPFGFAYRTKVGNDTAGQDLGYKIHLIWGATASPSEKSYETVNDSPEPITFSWECDTTPVNVEGYKPVSTMTVDSRYATAAQLQDIEDAVFGTTNGESHLPTPAQVIAMFA